MHVADVFKVEVLSALGEVLNYVDSRHIDLVVVFLGLGFFFLFAFRSSFALGTNALAFCTAPTVWCVSLGAVWGLG
jgi:hypothetical protein